MRHKYTFTTAINRKSAWRSVLVDYLLLIKFRLTAVVVLSSVFGYLIQLDETFSLQSLFLLVAGGFFVTASANALNQVLEKDYDILMERTAVRPVASGRMRSSEGVMFAGLSCLLGISLLAALNTMTAFLGMLSLILYAFVYTPLKRYSTLAVPVGAIPGALPVMIGAAAVDGKISMLAFCLFVLQFLWQFPHFWSIGFLSFQDYKAAGYRLLPQQGDEIDRNLGLSSMFYALMILPVACFMWMRLDVTLTASLSTILLTISYVWLSYQFHVKFDRTAALRLMFFSFLYLPLILLSYWLL
ncbi:MAG: heme o synthase [Saprospiraceae bacterium]|nr:heme o synthase [Saprospiraceae bacterium]